MFENLISHKVSAVRIRPLSGTFLHSLYDIYIGRVKDGYRNSNATFTYLAAVGIGDLVGVGIRANLDQWYGEIFFTAVASAPFVKYALRTLTRKD